MYKLILYLQTDTYTYIYIYSTLIYPIYMGAVPSPFHQGVSVVSFNDMFVGFLEVWVPEVAIENPRLWGLYCCIYVTLVVGSSMTWQRQRQRGGLAGQIGFEMAV